MHKPILSADSSKLQSNLFDEYQKKVTRTASNVLFVSFFVVIIYLIVAHVVFGFDEDVDFLIIPVLLILIIFCVLPIVLLKLKISEQAVKYVVVISVGLAIGYIYAFSGIVLRITLMLMPLVAALYFDKKFTIWMSLLNYLIIFAATYIAGIYIPGPIGIAREIMFDTDGRWFLMRITTYTIESIPFMLVLAFLSEYARRIMINLAESEVRLDKIINNVPGMVLQHINDHPSYPITYASKGSEDLLGYTPEELVGNSEFSFANFVHPDDKSLWEEVCTNTIVVGLPFDHTFRVIAKDGTVKWIWERSYVIEYKPDGTPYLLEGFLTDVTARQNLESAEAANRAKTVFLTTMSHELRTPMNAVIGMTELILREDISELTREYAMTIKHSGSHLLSIINDILDFSKIESGKMEIVNTDYFLHSTINDVVSIINTRITNPKMQFMAYMEKEVPNRCHGDEIRLRQILLNILNNAVKYTDKGCITLDVSWKRKSDDLMLLTLRIKDTGMGIKPEDMDRLFGGFTQFDLEKNRNVEGTGLGLAITHNLVKLMGGEISVESTYGFGSMFTVTLPQRYTEEGESEILKEAEIAPDGKSVRLTGQISIVASVNHSARFVAPDVKLLLVDDLPSNLTVALGLLAPYKVTVITCESGKEAIQTVQQENFDLVLLDHMMPEMDGLETMKVIRGINGGTHTKYAKLPIIVLTANAIVGAREMFLQNGFDDFLSKPIDVDKLDNILSKWIPREKQQMISQDAWASSERSERPAAEEPHLNEASPDFIIPGVNVKKGIAISNGSIKDYLYLLTVFRKDGDLKISQLTKCLRDNDLILYATYAHAVKAACINIGATQCCDLAGKLESAAVRHDLGFITKHNDAFIYKLKTLLTDIDKVIGASAAKPIADSETHNSMLKPLLTELKAALESFDASAIDKTSAALQDFTRLEVVGENVKDILHNAFTSKIKQAVIQIDELLEMKEI